MARINFVIAGACGLLLTAGGVAPTQAWAGSSDGDRITNSDTVSRVHASLRCGQRARFCVNGPLRSGNVRGQDVRIGDNASNSGSPTNTNGNTNSKDETSGPTTKSSNNAQSIGSGSNQTV
ncbi:hypothetical protein [Streptomyces sp. NPDC054765]